MIFADVPRATSIFVDANVFVYHFTVDPVLGAACTQLLERIETKELEGYTSANVLSEVAHRLMSIEASQKFGWPFKGIAQRMKTHPMEVRQLTRHRTAVDELSLFGIRVLDTTGPLVSGAADVSIQTGLLSSDALIVAVMRQHGLTHLASHDADFDGVPGITRYAPV
jgi:predicted nucleic acid-binding protein